MNQLGSLSDFQIDPNQDHTEVCGMRGATGYEGGNRPPVLRDKSGRLTPTAPPPLVGAGHGARLQREMEARLAKQIGPGRMSLGEVAERFREIEQGLDQLELAQFNGEDTTVLVARLRCHHFSLLTGEYIQIARAKTRAILEGMMRPERRRQVAMIDLNLFEAVQAARTLATEVATAKEEEFPAVARKVLDILRTSWPKDGFPSDSLPKGS